MKQQLNKEKPLPINSIAYKEFIIKTSPTKEEISQMFNKIKPEIKNEQKQNLLNLQKILDKTKQEEHIHETILNNKKQKNTKKLFKNNDKTIKEKLLNIIENENEELSKELNKHLIIEAHKGRFLFKTIDKQTQKEIKEQKTGYKLAWEVPANLTGLKYKIKTILNKYFNNLIIQTNPPRIYNFNTLLEAIKGQAHNVELALQTYEKLTSIETKGAYDIYLNFYQALTKKEYKNFINALEQYGKDKFTFYITTSRPNLLKVK